MKILLVDNYDSYTYNLFQLIAQVNGEEPVVIKNDDLEWEQLSKYDFDGVIISPGPGRPEVPRDFGVCESIILQSGVPVLGVCLGHQGIGHLYGARVTQMPDIMHGGISRVEHTGADLFLDIPQQFQAVRYHSLMVQDVPSDELEITAWCEDNVIMGIRHRKLPVFGIQFHPESVCTEYGHRIIGNFIGITKKFWADNPKSCPEDKTPLEFLHLTEGKREKAIQERNVDRSVQPVQILVRKINHFADPEQVFTQWIHDRDVYSFWLDSSKTDQGLARFSYMGNTSGRFSQTVKYEVSRKIVTVTSRGITTEHRMTIYEYLERQLARFTAEPEVPFPLNGGFVGYLGYELKADSGGTMAYASKLQDGLLVLADRMVVFDHQEHCMYLLCLAFQHEDEAEPGKMQDESWLDEMDRRLRHIDGKPVDRSSGTTFGKPPNCPDMLAFQLNRSYPEYIEDIVNTQQFLRQGESYEINLTNELEVSCAVDPLQLYLTLRQINPAPYSAYLSFGDVQVLCSSPECFIKADREGGVQAKPIKGTSGRGATPDEDNELLRNLAVSAKNRAENLMITDLMRNDLGQVCEVGSVTVPKLMHIETYQTVHQMVTTVSGKLKKGNTAVSCIRTAFPGGSMTGAPKIRSMELIDVLEHRPRGIYSGSIGYFALNGSADFNIVIRTIVCHKGKLTIGVGGAITVLSDPEEEYDEMLLKARALIKAIVLTACGGFDSERYCILGDRTPVPADVNMF
ncbi:para-aminobenzoate synthetase [Fontibacillus phaseoli]|uniref:aminodeoxychorismate synthase n=1 Tax=Fontibacillus phaseoli TaxID=1416533 RepID=A0A369B9V2_9BACL|nr:aminodeoxychorismate synthase component I [Fontibacillus phaseoli]RCX17336.1 para-aminobenzoate synthetase [Fontibacillus phaseoli]